MPSPDVIKDQLMRLPLLNEWETPSGRMDPDDRKARVWEDTEKGGHFHFYAREGWLWDPNNGDNIPAIGYTLSVTGCDKSKEAIVRDFTEVLGKPKDNVRHAIRQIFQGRKSRISYFEWLQPRDPNIENSSSLKILADNYVEAFMLASVPEDDEPRRLRRNNILPQQY